MYSQASRRDQFKLVLDDYSMLCTHFKWLFSVAGTFVSLFIYVKKDTKTPMISN